METILELVSAKILTQAISKLGPKLLNEELMQLCVSELDAIKKGVDILRTHHLKTSKKYLHNALTILRNDLEHVDGKRMLNDAYNMAIEGSTTVDKTDERMESMRLALFCLLLKFLIFASNNSKEDIEKEAKIVKELCMIHLNELNSMSDVIQAIKVEHLNKWERIGNSQNTRFILLKSMLRIHLDTNILFYSIKDVYTQSIDSASSTDLGEIYEDKCSANAVLDFGLCCQKLSELLCDDETCFMNITFIGKEPHKVSVDETFDIFKVFRNLFLKKGFNLEFDDICRKFLNILFRNIQHLPDLASFKYCLIRNYIHGGFKGKSSKDVTMDFINLINDAGCKVDWQTLIK